MWSNVSHLQIHRHKSNQEQNNQPDNSSTICVLRHFVSHYLCVRSRCCFSYLSGYCQLQRQVENSQMISGGKTLCPETEKDTETKREKERFSSAWENKREKNLGQSENHLWKALRAFFWYSSCIPRRDAVRTDKKNKCKKMVRTR